jgi:hypothetical protein
MVVWPIPGPNLHLNMVVWPIPGPNLHLNMVMWPIPGPNLHLNMVVWPITVTHTHTQDVRVIFHLGPAWGFIETRHREWKSEFLSIFSEHLSVLAPYGKVTQQRNSWCLFSIPS